jgi:hypothetical protein
MTVKPPIRLDQVSELHQCRNERQIARETIELGNDKPGLAVAAKGQRLLKLGAIIALAALDFLELDAWRCLPEITSDGCPLGLQSSPDRPW